MKKIYFHIAADTGSEGAQGRGWRLRRYALVLALLTPFTNAASAQTVEDLSTANPNVFGTPPGSLGPTVPTPAASGPLAGAGAEAGLVPAGDPPTRAARLSVLNGNVSEEPGSVNTFSAAELNAVLTTGDRLYTDPAAQGEIEAGGLALRLAGGTDLTVSALTDTLAQFGVAAGSVHLRSYGIDPGTVLEVDSPDAAVTVLEPGDVRVDVDPGNHTTTVTLISGRVQVDGVNFSQVLAPGERLALHGGNPDSAVAPFTESLPPSSPDTLDSFSDSRDNLYATGMDASSPYVSTDTVGGDDLAANGAWDLSDDGPVWYPTVAVGWQPYRFGHWCWVPPWGWTWVGVEPWGFAPFHYGRWALFHDRWGWIPGPRGVRPVYAPALVAFAGGTQFSSTLGFAPGVGIAAWFPLGPGEAFSPWYHGSIAYLNRVNASNLYNRNAAEVNGLYNQRAVNVFAGTAHSGNGYANRLAGTTAVTLTSFASGHSVARAALQIPAETLASAPVILRLAITPERSMLVPHPASSLPPVLARPVLAEATVGASAPTAGGTLFHRATPPAVHPIPDQQRELLERSVGGTRPGGVPAREAAPRPQPAPRTPAPAPAPHAEPPAAIHHP